MIMFPDLVCRISGSNYLAGLDAAQKVVELPPAEVAGRSRAFWLSVARAVRGSRHFGRSGRQVDATSDTSTALLEEVRRQRDQLEATVADLRGRLDAREHAEA
jgi:hypothetical protein